MLYTWTFLSQHQQLVILFVRKERNIQSIDTFLMKYLSEEKNKVINGLNTDPCSPRFTWLIEEKWHSMVLGWFQIALERSKNASLVLLNDFCSSYHIALFAPLRRRYQHKANKQINIQIPFSHNVFTYD